MSLCERRLADRLGWSNERKDKMTYWYIIDEDTCEIIKEVFGDKDKALSELKEIKDNRQPGDKNYWHVLTLFGRVS